MRRMLLLPLCLLAVAACKSTTGPTLFTTAGAWQSQGFATADVRVTLVETARSTSGAGRWESATEAHAFAVTGAHADSTVSLLFDFDDRDDITFEGRFRQQDDGTGRVTVMVGQLYGGGFRGESFIFQPDETSRD